MAMTLLGAVGTACLAWNGDKYGPAFKWIVPYMPYYQVLVYVSLVAGVAAAVVAYATVRGDKWFYVGALITLVVAGGAAAYQMYMTSTLRDISFFAAAPTNVRFYITVVTLLLDGSLMVVGGLGMLLVGRLRALLSSLSTIGDTEWRSHGGLVSII